MRKRDLILRRAMSKLEGKEKNREEIKRATTATIKEFVDEGMEIEKVLETLDVPFDPELPLEEKIDRALWGLFSKMVVEVDREAMDLEVH
jgi:hypothetical protein